MLRLLVWLFLLLLGGSPLQAMDRIELEGNHPIIFDDDPAFASPDYDDSRWQSAPIALPGTWQDRGASTSDLVFWQRIRFVVPPEFTSSSPALLIPIIAGADRVFLNGEQIGELGNIDAAWSPVRTTAYSASPRIYRFDPALLHSATENVLAIRHARSAMGQAGTLTGPMLIADYGIALDEANASALRVNTISIMIIVIQTLVLSAMLIALLLGLRDRAIALATLIFGLGVLPLIYSSPLVRQLGFEIPALVEIYLQVALALAAVLLLSLVALLTDHRIPRWLRMLQLTAAVLLLVPPIQDGGILDATLVPRFGLFYGLILFFYCVMSVWMIRAIGRGDRTMWPLLIGLSAVFIAIALEIFVGPNASLVLTGQTATNIGIAILNICMALVAGLKFIESQRKLSLARVNIIRAQETEQRRVAREIHDGVGQWLSTIKLNLQMLSREQDDPARQTQIDQVTGHLDEAIADTRRVAHDLSPVLIEERGLNEALQNHAALLSEQSDLTIDLTLDETIPLSVAAQGHLYRIFQEAVQNAVRHGGADHIAVGLQRDGHSLRFTIADNGRGFDPDSANSEGLGLRSFHERAALLAADLHIRSAIETGTKITVSMAVPLGDLSPGTLR